MRSDEYWNRFESTGNIYDYLQYRSVSSWQESEQTSNRAGENGYGSTTYNDRYGTVSGSHG